jgi:hypothetical protein
MPYSDFDLRKAKDELHVKTIERQSIFDCIPECEISDILKSTLAENVPLAVSINTEKARSELIIANILVEIRRKHNHNISLFSGIEFNVDKDRSLNGFCDFILCDSPEQLLLTAPIITIVEAKNENIIGGLGQCIAEMVGANIFNEKEGNVVSNIYGTVTTGTTWKFLKLTDNSVYIDLKEYYIENPKKLIGILSAMMSQEA